MLKYVLPILLPLAAWAEQVPVGCRILWPGTAASIPSGWSRSDAFENLFPRGAADGDDAGGTGGATTHTHNDSTSHTHTDNHTHMAVITGTASGSTTTAAGTGGSMAAAGHSHINMVTTAASGAGAVSTDDITADAASNIPPHETVLWLAHSGNSPLNVPANGVLYGLTPNNDFVAYGTDDDMFRIADSGDSGGGGVGGGAIHTHTSTHGHTNSSSHNHGNFTADGSKTCVSPLVASGLTGGQHGCTHHQYSAISSVTATYADTDITAYSSQLSYPWRLLFALQNSGSAQAVPDGAILACELDLVDIPTNWYLCDGTNGTPDMRERFIRITTRLSLVDGTNGNSFDHSHTWAAHTHTIDDHTHTATITNVGSGSINPLGAASVATFSHTHTTYSIAVAATDLRSVVAYTTDLDSTLPPYVDVLFLQYQNPNPGGLFIEGGTIEGAIIE